MPLYHTSHQIIEKPDVRIGRANADFGQGFYLTADEAFAARWARMRKGEATYINVYELDCDGLAVKRLGRDEEWFSYIFANRAGRPDGLPDTDVIVGPIANDTIYDTFGIFTSGLIDPARALELLRIGPAYEQIAVKTEMAAGKLAWVSARELSIDEVAGYRAIVTQEEAAFHEALAKAIEAL